MFKPTSIILLAVILFSCNSNKQYSKAKFGSPSSFDKYGEVTASVEADKSDSYNRVVLYSANLRMIVKEPDSLNVQLTAIAKKHGGYVLTIGNSNSVIRVKAEKIYDAVNDISLHGKMSSKNISGTDVTEEYVDSKIRLENARKARARYLELLAKAENVEAALKVEKELERLNGEIDRYKGKIQRLDHLSEFSTISIRIEEKKKPGPLGYIGLGLYYSVKWLFVRN